MPRLGRSCKPAASDWIRIAPSGPALERVEAFFAGHAFETHRHDTYAIGFTLQGVQEFRYRGGAERSLAGQGFVLHPDETHDGHAGTDTGFHYKIVYVEPSAIRDALGARGALPFVRETVARHAAITRAILPALDDLDRPLEPLLRDQVILDLAEALEAADPSVVRRRVSARHGRAVALVRDFLDAHVATPVHSTDLETIAGLTRYELARQFRACLGTSPYRYLILRRLDRARTLIRQGTSLADAALASFFGDQSHMTRQFKKAYGLPPGRWAAMQAAS